MNLLSSQHFSYELFISKVHQIFVAQIEGCVGPVVVSIYLGYIYIARYSQMTTFFSLKAHF